MCFTQSHMETQLGPQKVNQTESLNYDSVFLLWVEDRRGVRVRVRCVVWSRGLCRAEGHAIRRSNNITMFLGYIRIHIMVLS